MSSSLLPEWISKHVFEYDPAQIPAERLDDLRARLTQFQVSKPEVSIVIPAYNEEANLLNMLSSLADQQLAQPTELLVVNNNSSDRTQAILDQCGVRSILEKQPGVAYARQAGLLAARGRIIANADSDCVYPAGWSSTISAPLQKPEIGCTYGLYAFLPSPQSSRLALYGYEKTAQFVNHVRNRHKAYLNVYGFNFAFRREDALAVGGFELDSGREGSVAELVAAGITPPPSGRCEDGLMALALLQQGKGKILRVGSLKARVWTSDRRLMADGSLGKAFTNRVKQAFGA
ncbi:glycosyltransferase family 2 protein [Larkinella sp.]|uniref:glycosyltransferase family 2 protein n=1 Tax=Larkinella sp. TaxID=2034517 RepID=UPI003BAC0E79